MVACTSYCHDICQNSQNAFTNSEKEKRKIIFKKNNNKTKQTYWFQNKSFVIILQKQPIRKSYPIKHEFGVRVQNPYCLV